MINNAPLLIEIGTEELPPKSLKKLSNSFSVLIQQGLGQAGLTFTTIQAYATPRRLALKIENLAEKQLERLVEKRGPALAAAFDKEGNLTRACEGFLRSANATANDLIKRDNYVWIAQQEKGKHVNELIPAILHDAIVKLPIPKRMRWGNSTAEFVRPVHWLVLLYGNEVIPATLLEQVASCHTYGHRFHSPAAITIKHPDEYETLLEAAFVIADFEKRRQQIHAALITLAKEKHMQVRIEETLLDEVTALVEWPVGLLCHFAPRFLVVPKEALISAMEGHQKSFALLDKNENLLPHFITISNIESTNPTQVIQGNQRVMHARLSDAEFFYQTDKKIPLAEYNQQLESVIFQHQLGTMQEKVNRIVKLSALIAEELQNDPTIIIRTAELCKADLMTNLVGEFPELQGIAGYYYAKESGELNDVATGVKEHYYPRFACDKLPASLTGAIVAIADRLDTLVGIFGINQPPTGEKDPFGLRRAALGIIRIIIEKKFNLHLEKLLSIAINNYAALPNANVKNEVEKFIIGRLYAWYESQEISTDLVNAVLSENVNRMAKQAPQLLDIDARLKAIQYFITLPESTALIAANKRVSGILKKEGVIKQGADNVNLGQKTALFIMPEEKALSTALIQLRELAQLQAANKNYLELLKIWSQLREPIDQFFEQVMVNVEDEALKQNRLALLNDIYTLFLYVADISLLQREL